MFFTFTITFQMSLFHYRRCFVQSELIIVCFIACFLVLIHDPHLHLFTLKQQFDHLYLVAALLYLSKRKEERCLTCISLLIHIHLCLIGE